MEIKGDTFIPASIQAVWDALNDPDALASAIPGCQSVSESGDNQYDVVAKVAVGPVKATFRAKIELTDVQPPNSYVLHFKSHGGVAGVANGSAQVNLTEEGDGTRLKYNTDVQMGGKLTQIGGRLIESTADKMSAQFFNQFSAYLNAEPETEESKQAKSSEQAVKTAVVESEPGMSINIKMSTLSVGILMFVVGCGLGYLLAS